MTEVLKRDDVPLKADFIAFRRDVKRALVLQAIVIVALNVTLIKLLP